VGKKGASRLSAEPLQEVFLCLLVNSRNLHSNKSVAAITTAFGEAYIAALDMLFVNNNGESPTSEEIAEAFKKNYLQVATRN
jgi:hypothetical protein